MFLSLLKDTGVDIHAFVAKPYSISGGVVGYLRQLGVPVELWSYADLEEAMVLPALLRAAIKASRADGRALVLIDIGGYFSFHLPVLAPEDSSLVAGVVEVTSFGEERYARCATATRVPVVSVARNAIKEIEADIVVARALEVVERLVRPLDRQLTGATALVIGYGTIGQALALALRARGADVAVHDAEAQQELSAWWAGFGTGDKATLLREASFVFSATGAEGLSADGIGLCADRAVLVSLGSKDTEFDLAGLVGSGARQTLVADGLTEYQIASGKRVYVVRDGTAANFEVDSGPTASSDLLFTEIVAAMLALATRDERLQRGSLNALPRDIVNDVSRRWLEHASTSGKCVGWGARVC